MSKLTRREFIQATGIAIGVTALTGALGLNRALAAWIMEPEKAGLAPKPVLCRLKEDAFGIV